MIARKAGRIVGIKATSYPFLRNRVQTSSMRKYLLFLLPIVIVSCGSGSADRDASIASLSGDVASAKEQTDKNETSSSIVGTVSIEDAQLNFAACMREEYPAWPDPDPSTGRGYEPGTFAELGIDLQGDDVQALVEVCSGELRGVVSQRLGASPEERAETEDGLLDLFACVRESPGFEDLPDPEFSNGAGGFGALRNRFANGEFDPAAFRIAAQKCSEDGRGALPRLRD